MKPGRLLACAALTGALLAGGGCASPGRHGGVSALLSHLAPHPAPERGTFFEGWYLRVTAPEAVSVGAIAASWEDRALQSGESYVALFFQQPGATRLEVHDAVLTARPEIGSGGTSGSGSGEGGEQVPAAPSSFRWQLGEGTAVTERSLSVVLPDGARFAATLGAPVLWDPADPAAGPEGAWLNSPRLEGHWFVHSTASPVQWTLSHPDGRTQSGGGLAHFEKNWGASFPRRWAWAQGIDPRTGAGFVLAGGDNPLLPALPGGAWMLGVRTPRGAWNYATGRTGQQLDVWPDACGATVTVRADGPEGRVEITVAAPRESFGTLEAPRAGGFEPLSEMSFQGDAELRLATGSGGDDGDGDGEASGYSIPASALEFGGSWRCAEDLRIGESGSRDSTSRVGTAVSVQGQERLTDPPR